MVIRNATKIIPIIALAILILPVFAMSQTTAGCDPRSGGISCLITKLEAPLKQAIPLLIGAAMVMFIWGVLKYIKSGDNEEERKKAQSFILYGIIGLFVIVAVWGLVRVIGSTLGIDPGDSITIPQFNP